MRSIVRVVTSPPKVVGKPGPASSISTIRMLGTSCGSRRGSRVIGRPPADAFRLPSARPFQGRGLPQCPRTPCPLVHDNRRCRHTVAASDVLHPELHQIAGAELAV